MTTILFVGELDAIKAQINLLEKEGISIKHHIYNKVECDTGLIIIYRSFFNDTFEQTIDIENILYVFHCTDSWLTKDYNAYIEKLDFFLPNIVPYFNMRYDNIKCEYILSTYAAETYYEISKTFSTVSEILSYCATSNLKWTYIGSKNMHNLKQYEKINNISDVAIDTNIRYIITDNGKKFYREGGLLRNNTYADNYIVLTNGKNNWSVQVKDTIFFKRISAEEEIKRIHASYQNKIDQLISNNQKSCAITDMKQAPSEIIPVVLEPLIKIDKNKIKTKALIIRAQKIADYIEEHAELFCYYVEWDGMENAKTKSDLMNVFLLNDFKIKKISDDGFLIQWDN